MQAFVLSDLLELMARLRTPGSGCPWDLEQDYLSITPSTIEEVYEVVDAIEREDYDHLKEELGDLLFQIIFYAQLANEEGRFDFNAIVDALTAKLIRRHPHVFPDGTLSGNSNTGALVEPSEKDKNRVAERWEALKDNERKEKGQQGILADVPQALPSLQRAQKLQRRVAKVGMDWREVEHSIENLESEIRELREAITLESETAIQDELGDVLFSCVNVARQLKQDADQTLRVSNSKFERRINKMEELFSASGLSWEMLSDEQLDTYWQKSKRELARRK